MEVKGTSKSVKVFMQLGTYEEKWESDKGATSPAVRFRAHQMFTQKTSFFLLLFSVSLRSCSRALEAENSVFGQLLFHGFQFMYVGGCFFGPTYTYSVLRIEMLCQIKFWGGRLWICKIRELSREMHADICTRVERVILLSLRCLIKVKKNKGTSTYIQTPTRKVHKNFKLRKHRLSVFFSSSLFDSRGQGFHFLVRVPVYICVRKPRWEWAYGLILCSY